MIISIRISDDVYQKYMKQDPKFPQRVIKDTLDKYQDVPIEERFVFVKGEALDKIEKAIGTTLGQEQIDDLGDLVQKLCSVRVDARDVPLTKGQRYRLERESEFFKRSFDDLLVERLEKILLREWGL